jgi:hypothetical protein
MPRAVHLNKHCGLEEGGDLAPALDRCNELLAASRYPSGYAQHEFGGVWCDPGTYFLSRDASIDASGIACQFNNAVVELTNGASIWIGGPTGDYADHWFEPPPGTWDASMPAGRMSFRQRAGGRSARIQNNDAFAALTHETDWTAAEWVTIDLAFGRDVPFLGQWHELIGHQQLAGHQSSPVMLSLWREAGGMNLQVGFLLEQGPRGARAVDLYTVRIPDADQPFNRRTVSLQYQVNKGLRAAVDRVWVPARRRQPTPPADYRLADNRQLGAFAFGWGERVPGDDVALTLHGVSVCDQPRYQDGEVGTPQRIRGGGVPTDRQMFATNPPGNGGFWSMRPDGPGLRGFTSQARGWKDAATRTRAFVNLGADQPNYTRPGRGMTRDLIISGLNFVCESGRSGQSLQWSVPFLLGWSLGVTFRDCWVVDSGFSFINGSGISTYPVELSNVRVHNPHTGFICPFFSPPRFRSCQINYPQRAGIRCTTNGAPKIDGMFSAAGPVVAAIVVDTHDTEATLSVRDWLWNNEGGVPFAPLVYSTARKPLHVKIEDVQWGQPLKKVGGPLIHIGPGSAPVSVDFGSVHGAYLELVRVEGTRKLTTRYRYDPASTGPGATYPEDEMGVLKDTAEALKADAQAVKQSLTNAIGRLDELTADAPEALQAINDARASLATVKQALDGVAAVDPAATQP